MLSDVIKHVTVNYSVCKYTECSYADSHKSKCCYSLFSPGPNVIKLFTAAIYEIYESVCPLKAFPA
jgi:hypothetical protein